MYEQQNQAISAAMTAKGHTPGRASGYRTKTGKQYVFVACANMVLDRPCHVVAEYSVDRAKVTKSSVQYRCEGKPA